MKKFQISVEEKSLRKSLRLPITKELRYMRRCGTSYQEFRVLSFAIVEELQPSGSRMLTLTLEGEKREVVIHESFFAEMQRPSFASDMQNVATE